MNDIILNAHRHAAQWLGQGTAATFIPELTKQDPNQLGISVTTCDGRQFDAGDCTVKFTVQSISKLILLATALEDVGFDQVFSHVGLEPSGDRFNSIYRLELLGKKPSNPMINAGAIAVTSCIPGDSPQERFARVLDYARELLGNPALDYDRKVFHSESATGSQNRALAYMMAANGVIPENVPDILEVYFKTCSLSVNCEEISFLGAVLANNGICPRTGRMLIEPFHVRVIRSLMCTCGMYDDSGEFALRVGFPAKSGVGGGIMGAVPGRMGIGTYCPALDQKGNSLCGLRAMEYLSQALDLSLF